MSEHGGGRSPALSDSPQKRAGTVTLACESHGESHGGEPTQTDQTVTNKTAFHVLLVPCGRSFPLNRQRSHEAPRLRPNDFYLSAAGIVS